MIAMRYLAFAGAAVLAFAWCAHSANAQGVFTVTSSSFKDGERLATKMAGNDKQNPNCVRRSVSPALSSSRPPAGTEGYALIMYDPEGRNGLGVVHWVAYGIPASVSGFAEGETSRQTDKYVRRQEHHEPRVLLGPCTPPGAPHHYTFTLIATDLEPKALQAGMTRDEVMKALDGHAKGATRNHRHVLEAISCFAAGQAEAPPWRAKGLIVACPAQPCIGCSFSSPSWPLFSGSC